VVRPGDTVDEKAESLHSIAALSLSQGGVARQQCFRRKVIFNRASSEPLCRRVATNGSIIGLAKADATIGVPPIFFATYTRISTSSPAIASRRHFREWAAALLWNGATSGFLSVDDYTLMLLRLDTKEIRWRGIPIANIHGSQ